VSGVNLHVGTSSHLRTVSVHLQYLPQSPQHHVLITPTQSSPARGALQEPNFLGGSSAQGAEAQDHETSRSDAVAAEKRLARPTCKNTLGTRTSRSLPLHCTRAPHDPARVVNVRARHGGMAGSVESANRCLKRATRSVSRPAA
jgi:hypothetical protein